MHSKKKSIILFVVIILATLLWAGTIWSQTGGPCGVHGTMDNTGKCICDKGWVSVGFKGSNDYRPCSLYNSPVNPPVMYCGGHGKGDISTGKCICDKGWTGQLCNEVVCVHGAWDKNKGICVCEKGWEGPDCSKVLCVHGSIVGKGKCACDRGWTGPNCDQVMGTQKSIPCIHGVKDETKGICVCEKGWTGINCNKPASGGR